VTVSVAGVSSVNVPVTVTVPGAPVLSISKTHTGNFTQGQQGATYTVVVSNGAGSGPTSGSVTVTETVPTGLALVSMSATGWQCVVATKTCARNDALAGGSSYPPITVVVDVLATASSPQVNIVGVSGGGSANASWSDSTTITGSVALLSVKKVHVGDFAQGQQGATYTVTVSN